MTFNDNSHKHKKSVINVHDTCHVQGCVWHRTKKIYEIYVLHSAAWQREPPNFLVPLAQSISSVNFVTYFRFSLSLSLLTKMLSIFSHILVIVFLCSFSLVLVDENSLHFSQLLVITFSQNVFSF